MCSGVPYELARTHRGDGSCGDHPFRSHRRGDDQVSKWLRLCDAAFLQAGCPGADYSIRLQVWWRLWVNEKQPARISRRLRDVCQSRAPRTEIKLDLRLSGILPASSRRGRHRLIHLPSRPCGGRALHINARQSLRRRRSEPFHHELRYHLACFVPQNSKDRGCFTKRSGQPPRG